MHFDSQQHTISTTASITQDAASRWGKKAERSAKLPHLHVLLWRRNLPPTRCKVWFPRGIADKGSGCRKWSPNTFRHSANHTLRPTCTVILTPTGDHLTLDVDLQAALVKRTQVVPQPLIESCRKHRLSKEGEVRQCCVLEKHRF
jgi:hypothetical protein